MIYTDSFKRTKQSDAYNKFECNVNDICSNIFIRAVANGTKCLYVHFVHTHVCISVCCFLLIDFLSIAGYGALDDSQRLLHSMLAAYNFRSGF